MMKFKAFGREIEFGVRKSLPVNDNGKVVNISQRDIIDLFGSRADYINTLTPMGQARAFERCSILTSIITKKVSAISDARYWVKGQEGNDVEGTDILDKMRNPNPYQTLPEFVCMVEFFSQIFGKAYIVKLDAIGTGSFELYVVPNILVTENEKLEQEISFAPRSNIESYYINVNGLSFEVDTEHMFVVNDVTYSMNQMGGSVSRLAALQYPINTFVASYDAVNELLVNRGMLAIISMKAENPAVTMKMGATKEEKQELEQQLNRYGILRGKMKYAITGYDVACVPVSSSISDLGISEIQLNCKKDIAYTYQVPAIMLDMADSKYANLAQAKLDFYTNDIIPAAKNIMATMNRIYGNDKYTVQAFFDHLDLFQEAKRQQAAGMVSLVSALNQSMQSGLMNVQEAREQLDKFLV